MRIPDGQELLRHLFITGTIDGIRRRSSLTRLAVFVVTVAALPTPCARAQSPSEPAFDGSAIVQRLERENSVRDGRLGSYTATRRYSVSRSNRQSVSELVVAMQFVAPSTETFTTTSTHGIGWIHRRVFGRLLEAEQAASGPERSASAISTANYDAELVRSEQQKGRDCYVVALRAKHTGKYLFNGYAWIDKQDFAVVRLEGEPAQSPSFWVLRAPFVREFQRIDGLWFPDHDETYSRIRFAGEYILRIQYADYRISTRSGNDSSGTAPRTVPTNSRPG